MTDYSHHYALYGLTLQSNRPIPGLARARGSKDVVLVDFAGEIESAPATMPFWKSGIESLWHIDDDTWLLQYCEPSVAGYRWTIRYDGTTKVTVRWDSSEVLADIPAVLQGPGIAAALHLRGVPLLHACVLNVDGGAILMMGAPGAGKSTTAAALVRAGFPLVSDDLAALSITDHGISVHPGYPRLRLFTDSAEAAGWSASSLSRAFVTPLLADKRFVELSEGMFTPHELPVRAIYVLRPRREGGGDPIVTGIDRNAAWALLAQNVYSLRFLDPARRFRSVRDCAAIVGRIPLRSVEAGDDLGRLSTLVEVLSSDARAVNW